jgi:hypothetical protein
MPTVPVYSKATGKKLPFEVESSRVKFFHNITSEVPATETQTRKDNHPQPPASGETPKEK